MLVGALRSVGAGSLSIDRCAEPGEIPWKENAGRSSRGECRRAREDDGAEDGNGPYTCSHDLDMAPVLLKGIVEASRRAAGQGLDPVLGVDDMDPSGMRLDLHDQEGARDESDDVDLDDTLGFVREKKAVQKRATSPEQDAQDGKLAIKADICVVAHRSGKDQATDTEPLPQMWRFMIEKGRERKPMDGCYEENAGGVGVIATLEGKDKPSTIRLYLDTGEITLKDWTAEVNQQGKLTVVRGIRAFDKNQTEMTLIDARRIFGVGIPKTTLSSRLGKIFG